MRTAVQSARVTVCLGALLLTGCAGIGPMTIVKDRFDYVGALSDSAQRQMLLNLVKVRYGEAPVFMEISSVIGSYSLEKSFRGIGEYAIPGSYRSGDNVVRAEASAAYTDKPTITYQPLMGDKFARSLMAPIPISAILLLIQSGYPADLIFRLCVNTINGLENAYGGSGNPRAGSKGFHDLLVAIREAQVLGGAGFRTRRIKNGKDEVVMFLRPSTPKASGPIRKIRELLGLTPNGREFLVIPGAFSDSATDIAIQARSMLQVIIDFASYVQVPDTDIKEGRVDNLERSNEQERMFPRLIKVHQGPARPVDSHVAIPYRNRWFWIDDRDMPSKQILSILTLMFSLTESSPGQAAPVVTISAR